LFRAISQLDNVYLYCHTTYPDEGWDVPRLLVENSIQNRTFFSYICVNCKKVTASKFQGLNIQCAYCNNDAFLPQTRLACSEKELCNIINCFDLYAQISSCEALGIPSIESTACGVRVLNVNYSAMSDIINKLQCISIEPDAFNTEPQSGRRMAAISSENIANKIKQWINVNDNKQLVRSHYDDNYPFNKSIENWIEIIDSIPIENKWQIPPDIQNPEEPNWNLPNDLFIEECIIKTLKLPDFLGSWSHAESLTALNAGIFINNGRFEKIEKKNIFEYFLNIRNKINHWESKRKQCIEQGFI